MSTDSSGIYQQDLLDSLASITVDVSTESRYRILSGHLPWSELADVANKYRSQKIDINNGAKLDLRLHLGIYIAKSMNGWTDREAEEMVRYHVGVRVLCGIASSTKTIDHTSIETFRNMIGPEGAAEINKIIVNSAMKHGFTGAKLCASDTTVQEVPIAYPTEVGHMKKIGEALLGIGKKLHSGLSKSAQEIFSRAKDIFTEIRLFTRGKKEKAKEKKKKLSIKMQKEVTALYELISTAISQLSSKSRKQYQEKIDLFGKMLKQIDQWIKTGIHPTGKIISTWHLTARAITRDKVAKATEFGRRWIVTRLQRGYAIGKQCIKIGAGSDALIAEEILANFVENTNGEIPKQFVFDRGEMGQ